MSNEEAPCVLCVDDEPRVLEGLALHLRKDYRVHCAPGGAQALQKMRELGSVAVIVSDMRMPGMDGATLLKRVMRLCPEATRLLLTGEPGRDAAVTAVNEGQIFRFLTKPCPPDKLKIAVEAAVDQYRLVTAERVLLQETLIGCIQALIDVLAITNPVAFGRASRVKRMAMDLASALGMEKFWQLDAAAMLSQLGYLSLPVEVVEKLYYGERLTPEEKILAEGVPEVANKLLGHIPRLDPVLQILDAVAKSNRSALKNQEGTIALGAKILASVLEYDGLIALGKGVDEAFDALRRRKDGHDPQILEKLAERVGASSVDGELCEMHLRLVRPGMTIMQDVRTHGGMLLVPWGFEVSESFMQRMQNFGPGILTEKVAVLVRATGGGKRAVEA